MWSHGRHRAAGRRDKGGKCDLVRTIGYDDFVFGSANEGGGITNEEKERDSRNGEQVISEK